MDDRIEKLKETFLSNVEKIKDISELEDLRIKYLGRKSELTQILRSLGSLKVEERKIVGQKANQLKIEIEEKLKEKKKELSGAKLEKIAETEWIDITSPGSKYPRGHLNPITLTYRRLFEIGRSLGFEVVLGPEVETDWYNFEALNTPPDHPARDVQDSFYFTEKVLLRTHTSPVQIRYMEKHKPPIRIIVPGRVYRRDSDVTHTPMFHQMEGLLVDEVTTFSDLKGALTYFAKGFFGQDRKVRFRPHYFPFTEPSAEMDVSCGICKGAGCRACKYSGWLEILGAGMVHPNVLKNSGIDPERYQGFAFGMGIERLAMLKYNIDDLRLFFENDLRFLEQF